MKRFSQRDEPDFIMMHDGPNWGPLERLLNNDDKLLSQFMWMGAAKLPNRTVVHLYKNSDTRRYINVDEYGNTYSYTGKSYVTTPKEIAIQQAMK